MQSIEATRSLYAIERDSTEQLIRRLWELRLQDSAAAIVAFTAEHVSFRVIGSTTAGAPPSVFEGHEAVCAALAAIDRNLEFLSFDILDLIIDGADAALRWHAVVRNRGTRIIGELSVFDHIKVEAGRIVAYTEFLDTEGFRKLMEGEAQPRLARRANNRALPQSSIQPLLAANDAAPLVVLNRQATEDLLREFLNQRVKHGSAAVDAYWSPDSELHLIGDPLSVPFARAHVGLDAVRELIAQIDMEFAYLAFEIINVIVDRDKAGVHWVAEVQHRGTGMIGFVEAFDHVVIKGGKIQKVTEFFDTAETARWIRG